MNTPLCSRSLLLYYAIGNDSVPKIIENDTINLLFEIAIGILVISNDNSFRVLFDKIASVLKTVLIF